MILPPDPEMSLFARTVFAAIGGWLIGRCVRTIVSYVDDLRSQKD